MRRFLFICLSVLGFAFASFGPGQSASGQSASGQSNLPLTEAQILERGRLLTYFFYAVNINRYGETEDKYARMLLSTCYRHKDSIHGYGLKFWPEEFEKLKLANPQLAMFAERVKS